MRVRKTVDSVLEPFYYDGQMPVESDKQGTVTRNFVGARGIDAILMTNSSGTTTAYPLYDCHGNMVATLAKNGSGWSTGNLREYDVWGSVRTGASSGGPAGRYCANLGHVADDESGLIYMRARYSEPSSGRFISKDPARVYTNWYLYCNVVPSYADSSGKALSAVAIFLIGFILAGIGVAAAYGAQYAPDLIIKAFCTFLGTAISALGCALMALGASEVLMGTPLAPYPLTIAVGSCIFAMALASLTYHQCQIWAELLTAEGYDWPAVPTGEDNGLSHSGGNKFG